jgi:hypothetical protein
VFRDSPATADVVVRVVHPAAAQDGALILLGDPAAAVHRAGLLGCAAAAEDHTGLVLGDPAAPGHGAAFLLGCAAAARDRAGLVLGDPAAAEHRAPRPG